MIFDIKRHALEDGPGIRTTVFFKGCQLRCLWCQNPESIQAGAEIGFYAANCIRCGDCARACPGRGLRLIGESYPVEELTAKLLRDRVFYEVSGGGVTLSGGEPTLHMAYLLPLLKALKKQGIHTAIQTNGFFDWPEFEKVLDYLDLIMFDVKMANPRQHLKYTGRENGRSLENLARMLKARPEAVVPRIPLIPGMTATARNLQAISRLLKRLRVSRCSLLPYNPAGFSKAGRIGKSVSPRVSTRLMSPAQEERCREIFSWAEFVAF